MTTEHQYQMSFVKFVCLQFRILDLKRLDPSFSAMSSSVSGSAKPTTYELYERGRDEECQPTCINVQLGVCQKIKREKIIILSYIREL